MPRRLLWIYLLVAIAVIDGVSKSSHAETTCGLNYVVSAQVVDGSGENAVGFIDAQGCTSETGLLRGDARNSSNQARRAFSTTAIGVDAGRISFISTASASGDRPPTTNGVNQAVVFGQAWIASDDLILTQATPGVLTDDLTLNLDFDGDMVGRTLDGEEIFFPICPCSSFRIAFDVFVFLSTRPFSGQQTPDPLNPGNNAGSWLDTLSGRVVAESEGGSVLAIDESLSFRGAFFEDFSLVSENNPISVTVEDLPTNTPLNLMILLEWEVRASTGALTAMPPSSASGLADFGNTFGLADDRPAAVTASGSSVDSEGLSIANGLWSGTSIPLPEPSMTLLLSVGLLVMASRRVGRISPVFSTRNTTYSDN